ncbi:hypothetical protein EIP91_009057 [Steccherinum ochraceum]|uniref:F-box domain-containing protein n=1 Tax=Steccherinum ochraceum TaxID=92696 RepID=A0A4R0R4S4_9APHY|nr:hypothetical protein EIP91_009057 [Steccherinum ochraceum]
MRGLPPLFLSPAPSTPPATMDKLPAELLLDIFSYACNDGGYTGRALALVSKYVYAVSEHVRYQSVAVYGARHIETLSFRLTSSHPDAGLRKIRHLLLSDRSLSSSSSSSSPNPQQSNVTSSDGGDGGGQLVTNITFILAAIAPHLETLLLILTTLRKPTPLALSVLSFLSDLPFLPLIPTDLPALRELTIASPLIPLSFQHSKKASKLERLHIATHTELPVALGQLLRRIAPGLTHLRVSSVRGKTDGGGLFGLLETLVAQGGDTKGKIPKHLRRVIVAPRPATRSRGVSRVFGTLSPGLKSVCEVDTMGRVLVVQTADCLKEDKDHEKELYNRRYKDLKGEWLERLLGNPGCWIEGSGFKSRDEGKRGLYVDTDDFS